MISPPLLPREKRDDEHLLLLSIFHFVCGGLALMAVALAAYQMQAMESFLEGSGGKDSIPKEALQFFGWLYRIGLTFAVVSFVLNTLSGTCILKRRLRGLSIAVAAFDCIQIPYGTVLGVLTFIVLSRYSVREKYERNRGMAIG